MKVGRFCYKEREKEKMFNGFLKDGKIIDFKTRKEHDTENIKFYSPISPRKIVCIGFNYKKHSSELADLATKEPTLTLKSPSSVIGHLENIILPENAKDVQHEAELGIVIKKSCYKVDEPLKYIKGYTIVNDVTSRELERKMVQWSASKSFPTFCPMGPFMENNLDASDLEIICKVNGEIRQRARTSDMIYSPAECVRFASSFMRLDDNDLIATGTPAGVGNLNKGDVVEIYIEKIGLLKNTVE
jgi:2-keto-4-pentenoate hydratase/2-oxohepta-3-ene-1,7-dioic acid hydratase in catechol pathway